MNYQGRIIGLLSLSAWLLGSGACHNRLAPAATDVATVEPTAAVSIDSAVLFDAARQRRVPVVLYAPEPGTSRQLRLALLNHGYGGHNTDYSFVARLLVAHGYFVASIQHELPTDAPLPTTGRPAVVRRPNWERGMQNMLFVRSELTRRYPTLNTRRILLLGHSNGGDQCVLFTQKHSSLVSELITFDNRRLALPRTRRPRVLSLRSSDQPADSAVVPTVAEQARYRIRIAQLAATRHNDMWDGATPAQKREISSIIKKFLVEK